MRILKFFVKKICQIEVRSALFSSRRSWMCWRREKNFQDSNLVPNDSISNGNIRTIKLYAIHIGKGEIGFWLIQITRTILNLYLMKSAWPRALVHQFFVCFNCREFESAKMRIYFLFFKDLFQWCNTILKGVESNFWPNWYYLRPK